MDRSHHQNSYRNPKVFNLPFEEPKRKKRPLKIWKPLLIIIVLVGVYYFFFMSPVFQIKNIIADRNIPTAVTDYLQKYKGENIFKLKSKQIHDDLLTKYPELVDINVLRGIPDSIKVTFKERSPELIWQSGMQLYLMDDSGIVFKEVQNIGSLPTVKDNNALPVKMEQQVVTSSFVSFVTDLHNKLAEKGFEIDHFEVNETTFQVEAVTSARLLLKFDVTRAVDDQISDLEKFWQDHSSEPKSYIDLRVAGKVFYK